MKQKNLTILSLLTFMLLVFAGSALAQVTVEFKDASFFVGRTGQTIEMEVTAATEISMFDVVAEIADGGAWGTITAISCDSDMSRMDGPTEDIFRLWAMNLGGCDPVLDAGTSIACELTVDIGCDEGIFTITPTGIDWEIDAFTTATTTFLNTDCGAEVVTGVIGTYTVEANDPFFTNCPTVDLVFGCNDPANFDFDADDLDLGFCGEFLEYTMASGPGAIDINDGTWTWNSVGMVGVHNVGVTVTDTYGYSDQCDFVVVITNLPPVIDYCPPSYLVPNDGISQVWVCFGELAFGTVDAHDQDDPVCPGPLEYYLESFDGPGTVVVDSVTGDWEWQTDDEPEFAGVWTVVIGVTDQVAEDDVFCEFEIRVTGIEIKVAKTGEGSEFVFQGSYTEVPINAFTDGQDIGGFEFLMFYDASALTFIEATLGDYLVDENWEYFTYRKGPFGNCGGNCPSGLVRLIGINDVNNGMPHPNHPASWVWGDSIALANLKFYVTDDRTYECQYVPIGFYWLDCADNTLSDSSGYQIFNSRNVYWFDAPNDQYLLLDPAENPHIAGWQSIDAPYYVDCAALSEPGKPFSLGCVDFYFGGVDIACEDEIDAVGDLNLNNISNEIGDAVLYSNYFIYGMSVFTVNQQGQVAASDVNNDGKVLTVGDLVYLIRIITGDAVPYTKEVPFAQNVDVNIVNSNSGVSVNTSSSSDIGAALFVFDAASDADVVLQADGMDILSSYENGELRVLVYNIGSNVIPFGENEIFTVEANGLILTQSSIVDYNGTDLNVNARVKVLPTNFAVSQNYPNPFNPTTDVMLQLPTDSDWSLDVYNVNGQVVKSYSGYSGAGEVTVTVNGAGLASGIYFYKATIGEFSQVRKMVLMK
jgi:Secretion system C-terminal sorting domain